MSPPSPAAGSSSTGSGGIPSSGSASPSSTPPPKASSGKYQRVLPRTWSWRWALLVGLSPGTRARTGLVPLGPTAPSSFEPSPPRCLMPQGLADTVCGSPLYMAPEIIQSQKYDAKADLWSVGAILFQLVTGKPPFDGNNQIQLFHNILTTKELQFPQDILRELHPDCIDLCKSLLRQNPVERLTFEEFFNHKFMAAPRYPLRGMLQYMR